MTDSSRVLGVVLCGGQSSRMGLDKSLLKRGDGTSYRDHALAQLRPVCDAVALSSAEAVVTEHVLILDPVPHRGPIVGIASSLRFASQNKFVACLFTPVDMPNLTADDLQLVRQEWNQSGNLVVAQTDRVQPLVGIYPVTLLGELQCVAASDDRSIMKWINSQASLVTVSLTPHACLNVNTPEDLPHGS